MHNLIFALALVSAAAFGCSSPESAPKPDSPLGRAVPGSETPVGEKTEFDWAKTDPLAFLRMLGEKPGGVVTIWTPPPAGWVTEEHVRELMRSVTSTAPAAVVVSSKCSVLPFGKQSTVSREACFLITSFREGVRYPPRLSSISYFDVTTEDIAAWWLLRKKK